MKNPGPGGWAFLVKNPDGTEVLESGGETMTTNNRMEMRAMIEALRATSGPCVVYSDSEYLVKGASAWMDGWKRKGWVTSAKQPVKNQDLWVEIDALKQGRPVTFKWVKGHNGHKHNERVDQLANAAATAAQGGNMGYTRVRGESRPDVYRLVEDERERQIVKGYDETHDDNHTLAEFGGMIDSRAQLVAAHVTGATEEVRTLFVEMAALAVAALESMERRPGMRSTGKVNQKYAPKEGPTS